MDRHSLYMLFNTQLSTNVCLCKHGNNYLFKRSSKYICLYILVYTYMSLNTYVYILVCAFFILSYLYVSLLCPCFLFLSFFSFICLCSWLYYHPCSFFLIYPYHLYIFCLWCHILHLIIICYYILLLLHVTFI